MKIMLTNDDGIDAQGLAILEEVAREFGHVTTIAPKQHHSGCSHQMTFEGHLDAKELAGGRYWLEGYPADCVRVGLAMLCPDADLVISGINHGSNLGLDTFLSGTVAAAREANFFGLPSIAFSQYHRGLNDEVWQAAKIMAQRSLEFLLDGRLRNGHYWNVNFPCLGERLDAYQPTLEDCPLDMTPLPNHYSPNDQGFEYEGDYHQRAAPRGTDVERCHTGNISLTLVQTAPTVVSVCALDR